MVCRPCGQARAIVVVAALCASSARAEPPLAQAKAAVEGSDYLTAKPLIAAAIEGGTLGPDDLVEAYRLEGTIAGALGDAKAATEAFTRLLALSPKAGLPPGTSPKITKPFAAAQKYFADHEPLKVKTETSSQPPSVTLVAVSDPLHMVAKTRVWVRVDAHREKTLDGTGAIDLPKGKRLDLRAAALDEHGNRLVELGSDDVPIVVIGVEDKAKPEAPVPVVPVTKPAEHERPVYVQWWLWGGATVAIAGVGLYFGIDAYRAKTDLDALNADSQHHTFDEAKAVESRGHRDALITNISFGVAGAAAITTAILYLTRPHTEQERVTHVTPVPVRGGAAVSLEVPF
jgi:hypothetical protein